MAIASLSSGLPGERVETIARGSAITSAMAKPARASGTVYAIALMRSGRTSRPVTDDRPRSPVRRGCTQPPNALQNPPSKPVSARICSTTSVDTTASNRAIAMARAGSPGAFQSNAKVATADPARTKSTRSARARDILFNRLAPERLDRSPLHEASVHRLTRAILETHQVALPLRPHLLAERRWCRQMRTRSLNRVSRLTLRNLLQLEGQQLI